MKVDPHRLNILLAVHRDGGIVSAAETLGITASAVSQQINKLESEVGIMVINRTPTGATLTPAGKMLVESAERVEAELAEAYKNLLLLDGEITGTVIVGSPPSPIQAILIPLAKTIKDSLPGVDMIIQEVTESQGRSLLRSGGIDLLIMERDITSGVPKPPPRGMRDIPFYDEPWLIVLPEQEPIPSSLADMSSRTWLDIEPFTATSEAMDRIAATTGKITKVNHRFLDFNVAIAMVSQGIGCTVLPQLALQGTLPSNINVVSIPGLGSRQLVIRHRSNVDPTPAVQAVIDKITATAATIKK